jgi:hypothetical protein
MTLLQLKLGPSSDYFPHWFVNIVIRVNHLNAYFKSRFMGSFSRGQPIQHVACQPGWLAAGHYGPGYGMGGFETWKPVSNSSAEVWLLPTSGQQPGRFRSRACWPSTAPMSAGLRPRAERSGVKRPRRVRRTRQGRYPTEGGVWGTKSAGRKKSYC